MQKRSDRSPRRPATRPVAKGRPAMLLEGLEDRRLMSVVGNGAVPNSAVRVETSLGRMTFLLTPDVTPITVSNFLRYVNAGSYDNTIVHRAAPLENQTNDIIQAGGYKLTSGYPHVTTFPPIVNEFKNLKPDGSSNKVNVRGTVAMAKTSDPNSATSEWFVNVADNTSALDDPNNSGGFTTFARVIGGGMHVADAIANLRVINATGLNSAFSTLPVIPTITGQNPIVVSSAKAQTSLQVKIDASTKFVTWRDEKGGNATITLSKGTADLLFVGGNDMRPVVRGNRIVITGKNVDLEDVTTHGTTKASVLSIKSAGGNGPAHIGNVTVEGGSLGSISASTIQLQGDITAANGSIGSINLQGTYRSTILTNGGSLSLRIGTAFDTSVNTSASSSTTPKGAIKSLTIQRWQDDGQLPTSIVTGSIGSMAVNGNFSSNIRVAGDVGRLKVNGNVGTLGASTWAVGGNLKTVQVGKVMGLKVRGLTSTATTKDISNFRAREVLTSSDGTTTAINARSIGRMTLATLTNQSSITATAGIGKVAISGLMDSSTIRAGKNIGTVAALSMTGNNVNSTGTALVASGIYAGVVTTLTGPVTQAASFRNTTSTIGSVRVQKTFSNTNIAAPILQDLNLGSVQAASTQPFGVTAHVRIGHLGATIKGKTVNLRNATTDEAVENYFEKINLPLKNATNGNRFTVDIV